LNEKSQLIDKLKSSRNSRASYIRAKIAVLLSAQLHALRLKHPWTQHEFAQEVGMKQSRISAMEQPGAVNFNMETLIRSAAAHGVGLVVKFVSFSEMLRWENDFNQDFFYVVPIEKDIEFITGNRAPGRMATIASLYNSLRNFAPLFDNYGLPSQESLSPKALDTVKSEIEVNRPNLTSALVYQANQDQGRAGVSPLAVNMAQE
jgi:transcriptional regulator with XRE-family HTH domain